MTNNHNSNSDKKGLFDFLGTKNKTTFIFTSLNNKNFDETILHDYVANHITGNVDDFIKDIRNYFKDKTLDLSKSNIEHFLNGFDIFKYTSKIIFPKTFKSMDKELLYPNNYLQELDFSQVENLKGFPEGAFQNLKYLKKIILPENSKIKITANMFNSNAKLNYMHIAEHSSEISSRAFSHEIIKELIKKGMNVKFDKSMMIDASIPKEKVIEILQNSEIPDKNNYLFIENLNELNIEYLKYIIDNLPKGKNIDFVLNRHNQNDEKLVLESSVPYLYTKEEFAKLAQINEYLKEKTGKELLYQEFYNNNKTIIDENCWSHSKVETANRKIDDIVDIIKNNKMTQLEAMIYIHKQATSFVYNSEDSKQLPETSRTIVGLYPEEGFPNIVCVGYASFVKAVIDKLNMPGLKCSLNGCHIPQFQAPNEPYGHANNIIEITDPNYNINGTFIEDSCWGAKQMKKEGLSLKKFIETKDIKYLIGVNAIDQNSNSDFNFSSFLFPISDINNIYDHKEMFIPDYIMKDYLSSIQMLQSNFRPPEFIIQYNKNLKETDTKIDLCSNTLFLLENGYNLEDIEKTLYEYKVEKYEEETKAKDEDNDLRTKYENADEKIKILIDEYFKTKYSQDTLEKEILKKEIHSFITPLKDKPKEELKDFVKKELLTQLKNKTKSNKYVSKMIFQKFSSPYKDQKTQYKISKKTESKLNKHSSPLTFDNFCKAYKNCFTKTGEFNENEFNEMKNNSIRESLTTFTLDSHSMFIKHFFNDTQKTNNSDIYINLSNRNDKEDLTSYINKN